MGSKPMTAAATASTATASVPAITALSAARLPCLGPWPCIATKPSITLTFGVRNAARAVSRLVASSTACSRLDSGGVRRIPPETERTPSQAPHEATPRFHEPRRRCDPRDRGEARRRSRSQHRAVSGMEDPREVREAQSDAEDSMHPRDAQRDAAP